MAISKNGGEPVVAIHDPWVVRHPMASFGVAAFFLLGIGFFIVETRTPVSPQERGLVAWGGNGTISSNPSYAQGYNNVPPQNQPNIMQQVQSGPPYTYKMPSLPPQPTQPGVQNDDGTFNVDAFAKALGQAETGGVQSKNQTDISQSIKNAYAFIPTGLVSTTTGQERTDAQNALYEYGNEAGSYIQSFEQANANETQVLKDFIADRNDPDKANRVIAIGNGLAAIGKSFDGMDAVPDSVAGIHAKLVKDYATLGQNLSAITLAHYDADFIKAINTYNDSANTFTKDYISLVTLLSTSKVVFAPSDPGSVFVFTNASDL